MTGKAYSLAPAPLSSFMWLLISRSAIRALFKLCSVGSKCNVGNAPVASVSSFKAKFSNFVAITVRGLPFPKPSVLPSDITDRGRLLNGGCGGGSLRSNVTGGWLNEEEKTLVATGKFSESVLFRFDGE